MRPPYESLYATDLGISYRGDAMDVLAAEISSEPVSGSLIVTSPPFALQRPKEYGNEPQGAYVSWFLRFADEFGES